MTRKNLCEMSVPPAVGPAVLFDHRFGVRHYHYRRRRSRRARGGKRSESAVRFDRF